MKSYIKSKKSKKITSLAMVIALLFSIITPTTVKAIESLETVTIQILATSDAHGRFLPYDYAINAVDNSGSLAQIATAVKELREKNANTILIDNGDTVQDNSQGLFLDNSKNLNGINPMVLAMNEIGYDAWNLGNHEFNYGIGTIKEISSKFTGTVLCGNVASKSDGETLGAPYAIVEKEGVKVAIIGMVTPNIDRWDSVNLADYNVLDAVEETQKAIAAAKLDGAQVFIAAQHMGLDQEYGVANSGVTEIANSCPELTAIIAGHAHSIVNKSINGVLIVEPGKYVQNLSKIEIVLTKQSDGSFSIQDKATDVKGSNIAMAGKYGNPIYYAVDTDLETKLNPYHEIALADANTVIGELKGGDLVTADEVTGIPTAQIQPTAMIELINKVQMYYGKEISPDNKAVDVSAAAAFQSNANIKEGQIKKSDTSLIYKYDNTLYILEVTGKQLKEYMEWSANYYNMYKAGDLTVSFNPTVKGYNYDMFSGVKYNVDISKASGSRIVNLTKNDGTAIKDEDILRLAVNNYRATTNILASTSAIITKDGDYPKVIVKSEDVMGDAGRVRDLIRDYIVDVKGGVITPEYDKNWSIIGNNWDLQERAAAVKAINESKLELPASDDGKSWNAKAVTYNDLVNANKIKHINILSFNDFHGAVENSGKNSGIAKFAGEINRIKNTNPDTLVVSAGDSFQGSAMSNLTYGAPVNEFMKYVGVTASAVGNHEFDWGIDKIAQWSKDGEYDFLASNIYSKTTSEPVTWAKAYKIVDIGGIKVGLIGLATPETEFKTKTENVKDLEFKDPIESAKLWATKLKDGSLPEGKADVVIALTHLGAFQDSTTKVITGEAADLANANTGVDAIVSAHTHQTVSGKVNNTPIVQAYYSGRTLARLTIDVDTTTGKITTIEPTVDNLYSRSSTLIEDSGAKEIENKYVSELAPILNQVIATTEKDLTHNKLTEGTSILGAWTCDVMKKAAGTEIGITNGGGLRTSILKGNITMGNMYEVMPFDNTLVTMKLKGSDLKRVLENGIGNDSIGWVQVTGIKAYYDLNRTFGDRITSIVLSNNKKIDMNEYYTVVTNDFMATGGDKYDFTGATNVVDTQIPIRDALVNELKAVKSLNYIYETSLVNGVKPEVETPETETPETETPEVETPGVETPGVGTPEVEIPAVKIPEAKDIIDITKNSLVGKSYFESSIGKNKSIKFVGNGITWEFNGLDLNKDFVAAMTDIDLSMETPSDELKGKIKDKVKAMVGKDVPLYAFSLTCDGQLPGKASVTVFVGNDWANKTIDVARYYSDKNTYEIVDTVKVDKNGYMTFTTDHCSDYFITETSVAKLPKTGSNVDTSVLVTLGSMMTMVGFALFMANRKKEEEVA